MKLIDKIIVLTFDTQKHTLLNVYFCVNFYSPIIALFGAKLTKQDII